jgi:ADP-ribose pyrophosphatase YjhB (NUDIX family)
MRKGKSGDTHRNPVPTVDIIIETEKKDGARGIVLIKRKNPPFGWALPGGFVDYGESLEAAAVREAREETALDVELQYQLHTYSDPDRDPRQHTISTVFVARGTGTPKAQDDARDIGIFSPEEIPIPLAFDHEKILNDYFQSLGEDPMNKESKPKMDPGTKLAELHKVWGPVEAEVIKTFLESNGIPCILQGRIQQSIYPFSTDGLGEIKILVSENDLETAKKLLADLENNPPDKT